MNQRPSPTTSVPGTERHDLSFYHFIINSLPIAVATVDPELKITGFNTRAQHLTGYSEEEAIGRHCSQILKGGMCERTCPLKTVIKRQEPLVRLETTICNRRGDIIPVQMNTAGLFDQDGQLIGGVEAFLDISERKTREREKANLISMLAHDMNSSLTGIHGLSLRLLKTTDLNEERSRKLLAVITKEAAKLELLVHDFLEFSRLQTGRMKLNFDAISLDKELQEVFQIYEPKAAECEISLRLETAESLPIIEADANRLRRVFTNLLDNALKFSSKGTTVTITVQTTHDEVMVSVKDEGSGISVEELPYIFDIFHRGIGAGTSRGHGMGLAIVKAIVEGHGGKVMVTSDLGQGSTFGVLLPKIRRLGEE